MTHRDRAKRHARRTHEQRQHAIRKLTEDIETALAKCHETLKQRKKSIPKFLVPEMEKHGFTPAGSRWDRLR